MILRPYQPLLLSKWFPVLGPWLSIQTKLKKVIRWEKYIGKDNGIRIQNSGEHSLSLALLGIQVLGELSPYVALDEGFVLSALVVHDFGEGEIGKDTLYANKSPSRDVEEYLAFRESFESNSNGQFHLFHRAFLLQFASDSPSTIFPDDAQVIMKDLMTKYPMEVLAFRAIEIWDYLYFAFEQYARRGNSTILVQTLRHQFERLDDLAENLPGFREQIWTRDIRGWCENFLETHKDQMIEKKEG